MECGCYKSVTHNVLSTVISFLRSVKDEKEDQMYVCCNYVLHSTCLIIFKPVRSMNRSDSGLATNDGLLLKLKNWLLLSRKSGLLSTTVHRQATGTTEYGITGWITSSALKTQDPGLYVKSQITELITALDHNGTTTDPTKTSQCKILAEIFSVKLVSNTYIA